MRKDPGLDEALQRLRATPPRGFVAARNEEARALRAAGKLQAAKAVAALRRPAPPVWAVNALGREHPELVRALIQAGDQVRMAQRRALSGAGTGALKDAQRRLQDALQGASRAAVALLRSAKEPSGAAVAQRVRDTLLAASTGEGDAREALRQGKLEAELSPTGFGFVSPLRVVQGEGRARRSEDPDLRAAEAERRRERALAQKQVARREKELEAAASARERLERAADEAEARARSARAQAHASAEKEADAERALLEAKEVLEKR